MSDHYRRVKDKTELVHSFKLRVEPGKKEYIEFYIWGSLDALWNNVNPNGDPEWKHGYPACCLCFVKENRKQSEIHLVIGKFGVGVVAHELCHFFLYWISIFDIQDDERACLAMGNWNSLFWQEYYRIQNGQPANDKE